MLKILSRNWDKGNLSFDGFSYKKKDETKTPVPNKSVRWVSYDIKENGWLFVLTAPQAIT
jgi:hypothetical protein